MSDSESTEEAYGDAFDDDVSESRPVQGAAEVTQKDGIQIQDPVSNLGNETENEIVDLRNLRSIKADDDVCVIFTDDDSGPAPPSGVPSDDSKHISTSATAAAEDSHADGKDGDLTDSKTNKKKDSKNGETGAGDMKNAQEIRSPVRTAPVSSAASNDKSNNKENSNNVISSKTDNGKNSRFVSPQKRPVNNSIDDKQTSKGDVRTIGLQIKDNVIPKSEKSAKVKKTEIIAAVPMRKSVVNTDEKKDGKYPNYLNKRDNPQSQNLPSSAEEKASVKDFPTFLNPVRLVRVLQSQSQSLNLTNMLTSSTAQNGGKKMSDVAKNTESSKFPLKLRKKIVVCADDSRVFDVDNRKELKEMEVIAGEEMNLIQRQHPFLKKTLQARSRTLNSFNTNSAKNGSKSDRNTNGIQIVKNKDSTVQSMSMKIHDVDDSIQFSILPVNSVIKHSENPFPSAERSKPYNNNNNNNNNYSSNHESRSNSNNGNKNDINSSPMSYIQQSKLNVIAVYGAGKSSKTKENDRHRIGHGAGDEETKRDSNSMGGGYNKSSDVNAIQKRASPTDGPESQHFFDIRKSPEKKINKSVDKSSNIGFCANSWKDKFDHFHVVNEYTDLSILKSAMTELKKSSSVRKSVTLPSPSKESKISRINKSRVPQTSVNNDRSTPDKGEKQDEFTTIEYFAILVDNNVSVEKSMEKLRDREYVSEIHFLCQNSPINVDSYYSAIWGDKIPF